MAAHRCFILKPCRCRAIPEANRAGIDRRVDMAAGELSATHCIASAANDEGEMDMVANLERVVLQVAAQGSDGARVFVTERCRVL